MTGIVKLKIWNEGARHSSSSGTRLFAAIVGPIESRNDAIEAEAKKVFKVIWKMLVNRIL